MSLNITELEKEYLLDLLDNDFLNTMREENRTDTLRLKHELKHRITLIDNLRSKIRDLNSSQEPVYHVKTV
jgi:hypothetical protein